MNEAKNEHRCRQWLSIKQDLSELLAHYGVVLCLPPGLQVNQCMEACSKWLLLPCAWAPVAECNILRYILLIPIQSQCDG